MGPQTWRIWNLGTTKVTSKLYTLLFTWKYAFHEAACFKGLIWTHEKVILLCIPEAGVLYKLGQLKWKIKIIPVLISMMAKIKNVAFGLSTNQGEGVGWFNTWIIIVAGSMNVIMNGNESFKCAKKNKNTPSCCPWFAYQRFFNFFGTQDRFVRGLG